MITTNLACQQTIYQNDETYRCFVRFGSVPACHGNSEILSSATCYAGPTGRNRPKAVLPSVAIQSLGWRGNDIEPSRRGFNDSPQLVRNARRCHISGRNGQVDVAVATGARISDPVWVDHEALAHRYQR